MTTGETALRSLVRMRSLALERARQALADANRRRAEAVADVASTGAAIEAQRAATPDQEPQLMTAAKLRRRGARLRAHQAQLTPLTVAHAAARALACSVDELVRDAQVALGRADAEHRVAEGRRADRQRAVNRGRRAAQDDELDDLSAVRGQRHPLRP